MKREDKETTVVLFDENAEAKKARQEYESKLSRHRRRVRLAWLAAAVLLIGAAAGYFVYDIGRVFHSYAVKWEQSMEDRNVEFCSWGTGILEYSQNGVSYVDSKGVTLWSEPYHMAYPYAVIREDYVLILDQRSSGFVICSRELGMVGSGTAPYAITKGDIAENGVAALTCENETVSYICYYKSNGTRLDIEIKAPLERTGYPLDVAISADGRSMAVSYLYVESGVMQNRMTFYNFNGDADEYIAGVFEYGSSESMIPEVRFFDNTHAVAAGDNVLTFYRLKSSGQQIIPEKIQEYTYDRTVLSVFEGEDSIGVVLAAGADQTGNTVVLYDAEGNILLTKEIDISYTGVFFNGRFLVLNNQNECVMYDRKGTEKFRKHFANGIGKMIQGASDKQFVVKTADMLQCIYVK